MTITTEVQNNIATITVNGEVDASNAVDLDNVLKTVLDGSNKNVFLDCQNLEYISSAGLGVIMSYIEDIKKSLINFKIFNLSASVFEVFQILGLNILLDIVENESEALKSI